jgi:hypothetical protein
MRRLAVTALIPIAACAAAAVALASPLAPTEVARSKAVVRVKTCSFEDRSAVFYARMRRLNGTRRMRMRFTLLERAPDATRFKRVHVPGLSRWHKSAVGVRAYGYSQKVRGLHDGSVYRMRVRYRWYDQADRLQHRARRTSRRCRMFASLPNLQVRPVGATPGDPYWHYTARVTNSGDAPATDVGVQLRVDGAVVDTDPISHLDPGQAQLVGFDAPSCAYRYAFRVDPAAVIAESNEADNRAVVLC